MTLRRDEWPALRTGGVRLWAHPAVFGTVPAMNAEEFPAIVAGHPDDFDACDCAELGQHILAVQGSRLRSAYAKVSAEQVQLRATVADLDDALTAVLAERDALERLLDTFAYTVAPVEEIGEHSSANCPWRNALERLQ